jgi:hypothetical protein
MLPRVRNSIQRIEARACYRESVIQSSGLRPEHVTESPRSNPADNECYRESVAESNGRKKLPRVCPSIQWVEL